MRNVGVNSRLKRGVKFTRLLGWLLVQHIFGSARFGCKPHLIKVIVSAHRYSKQWNPEHLEYFPRTLSCS